MFKKNYAIFKKELKQYIYIYIAPSIDAPDIVTDLGNPATHLTPHTHPMPCLSCYFTPPTHPTQAHTPHTSKRYRGWWV